MKLQLAMDDITLNDAINLLEKISDSIDIIEIGTPFLLEYGMDAIRHIRSNFPDKEILCDAKIMDGGTLESTSAFKAGADYITVLAVSDNSTIKAVVAAAKVSRKQVVADLICAVDFHKTIPQLEAIGVDIIAVHVGIDQQLSGRTPLKDLIEIKKIAKNAKVAVAGGISFDTLDQYLEQKPDIIIVGSAIMSAQNPTNEAKKIYSRIQEAK